MTRALSFLILAAFVSACAAAQKAPAPAAAEAPPPQPQAKPEYERILGTFHLKTDVPIYLTPRLLERAYDEDPQAVYALANLVYAFQQTKHVRGEAAARLNYGAVLWKLGHGGQAYDELRTASGLFTRAGDLEGSAHAHEWLGWCFKESGEKDLAEEHLALAYQMFTKLENRTAADRILSYAD